MYCLLFAINGWIFAAVMLYSSVMHYLYFMCNILDQYHVSYASDLACIKHNRVVKAAGRAFMRFVAHLMLLCLLCCPLSLFFAEHCLFSDMLFHMLFMPK